MLGLQVDVLHLKNSAHAALDELVQHAVATIQDLAMLQHGYSASRTKRKPV